MQITILPDKNINIDSEMENYIIKKIESLKKILKNDDNINCEFRIGKNSATHKGQKLFFAEAKIITVKKTYGARADQSTAVEAIDAVKDELSKKIRRYKDKKIGITKRGGRLIKKLLRKFSR